MNETLEADLIEQVRTLSRDEQQRVLDYARSLGRSKPIGVPGKELLRFAGLISHEDIQLMNQAIEEGCERIDSNEW